MSADDTMKSDSWFPCYPADLIADTSHLSSHDFGAYWRLLCWYYLKGPPPNDDEHLRNVMRVETAHWVRARGNILEHFFHLGPDGCWHQKRADEEIAKRAVIQAKKRENALKGVAARRELGQLPNEPLEEPLDEPKVEPKDEPLVEQGGRTFGRTQPQPQPQLQLQPQPQQRRVESEGEWLDALKADPAYEGIEVGREYGKMVNWCKEHRKQPTRRRFINWLNRCDTPLAKSTSAPADGKF